MSLTNGFPGPFHYLLYLLPSPYPRENGVVPLPGMNEVLVSVSEGGGGSSCAGNVNRLWSKAPVSVWNNLRLSGRQELTGWGGAILLLRQVIGRAAERDTAGQLVSVATCFCPTFRVPRVTFQESSGSTSHCNFPCCLSADISPACFLELRVRYLPPSQSYTAIRNLNVQKIHPRTQTVITRPVGVPVDAWPLKLLLTLVVAHK